MTTRTFRARIVRVIALKELLEALRDRRTLFMMIFVPVLLYPALFLILTQVASLQQARLEAQTSVIGVDASQLAVHPALADFLDADEALELRPLELSDDTAPEVLERLIAGDDPARSVDAVLRLEAQPAAPDGTASLQILYESIEEPSRLAAERLEARLEAFEEVEIERRLSARGLPRSLADPVASERTNLSDSVKRGGFVLASILPMLVVITVLLGAFYPAIDLTAGEKERGSIQTLFAAPISVLEIVAGKYLAVVVIALISGLANLLSMGLMFGYVGQSALGGMGGQLELGLGPGTLGVLLVVIVLIAIFFAALVLAVAVLARDFKDAQNLLTPVFMLALVPGMIAQLPGFELTPSLAMVPGVNVILLMKQVLVYGVEPESLFLVAVSSLVATLLALVLAAKLFGQERVIVGERGRFDILARPSQIVPRERPSASEGLAWYGIAFVLLFYLGTWAQARDVLTGLLITLWLVLLVPTLGLARYLKLDFKATFNLRRPPWQAVVAALLMGPTTWIVVDALNVLVELVLPTPPEFVEGMEQLFSAPQGVGGWAYFLFVLALTPGICEEMLFRGFLFSSLRGRVKPWTLVLATAVMFGLFHLSIYRLFGTTVLGVVMGVLVYRSRSIFPAMLFHALNNAAALVVAHTLLAGERFVPSWLVAVGAAGVVSGLALLRTIPPASARS